MNRTRWRVVLASALAVVACLGLAAPASASPAAAPCTADPAHNRWYCSNFPKIEVTYAYKVVGYLNSGYNYFFCRYEGDYHNPGGPHPYRWIYTQADNGAYGFVSDDDIYNETDVLRVC